jgi:hypothetical protein
MSETKLLTLYDNHDFSKFAFDVALYKIWESGCIFDDAYLVFSTGSNITEDEIKKEIGNKMEYKFVDTPVDFWMIIDPEKKFCFFSYGA